jgi:4-diphosphocytidyl-2-C-methyl-D-erythritol kinase
MAVKLGADVPFFINGGCMRSEGIGEILTPAKPLNKGVILLAKADLKPSTAEMYRRLDKMETVLAGMIGGVIAFYIGFFAGRKF